MVNASLNQRAFDIKDPGLAADGRRRIDWASREMPVLRQIQDQFAAELPLDGVRIVSRKTLEPMTRNHLPGGRDLTETSVGMFAETAMRGTGFGLGFSVNLDPVAPGSVGSAGEFAWGGAASTIFWVDPAEDLIVVFLTQLFPSRTFNFRGQLEAIVYGAIDD